MKTSSPRSAKPVNRSAGAFDLALFTDGLRAEREQGITIDVAYRYFSTPKRKFIIADTPGHEQYTRNMATGASTANLAIILVDARNGVLQQSRRHAFIASMLGIQHIVVAVNKMDLVGYSEEVFERIRAEFADYASRLQAPDLHFIPISALKGDNVVEKSAKMPWFDGSSLLHYLETVHIASDRNLTELRFPVQYVVRPNLDFRGYAGQVASGVIKPGDPIMVLPSGRTSRVRSIVTYDGELAHAFPPMSVTVCLEDEIDISRGDMLVPPSHPPHVTRRIDARLVWMHEAEIGDRAKLSAQAHHPDRARHRPGRALSHQHQHSGKRAGVASLGLNDIGAVVIETPEAAVLRSLSPQPRHRQFHPDRSADQRHRGGRNDHWPRTRPRRLTPCGTEKSSAGDHRISRMEQQSRAGHRPVTMWLETAPEVAYQLERLLFDANCRVHSISAGETGAYLPEVARILNDVGVIAIVFGTNDSDLLNRTRDRVGSESFLHIPAGQTAEAVQRLLEEQGFISGFSGGD